MTRGLKDGIVTTRYPRRHDDYGPGFRGAISLVDAEPSPALDSAGAGGDPAALCPTGAITRGQDGSVSLDRGRCILCGRCVEERPDRFRFDPLPQTAVADRRALVVPLTPETEEAVQAVRAGLARRVKALRRSVHLRHVDAGSDGSEEWEIAALTNPVYDLHRLGMFFTASPRHADLLLVTGVGTAGMAEPLRHTYEVMPDPKVVVAVGADATSGGLIHPTYASGPGVERLVPVDVWVPGSPPSPFAILHGLLLAIGLLARGGAT
ncbi:MAG: NADH-quinone oxidoreductase subunit B family protein [Acidimicrobiales bacterium]